MDGLEDRVVLSAAAVAPAIVWTGNADDGLWSTPTNWSGDAVPKATDDVEIHGAATVTVNAAAQVNNLITDVGVTLVFNAGVGISGAGTFLNEGTISKPEGGGASSLGIKLNNQGTIFVGAGGTLNLAGGLANYTGTTLAGGTYEVSGTLGVPGRVNQLANGADVKLLGANPSILEGSSNALSRLNTIQASASLTIQGNALNNTSNDGLINYGSLTIAAGSLKVNNENFTQTETGSLTIGIAANAKGIGGYGYLELGTGEAYLDGALNVTLLTTSYVPAAGDKFSIIGTQRGVNIVNGAFDSFSAPGLPPSVRMGVDYQLQSVDLVVYKLTSIDVSPTSATIAKGETQRFAAAGTYSDGSTVENLDGVSWGSNNLGSATVDSTGLATGVGVGDATITAAVGEISGSATLTVQQARLLSLDVSPSSATIAKGQTATFTATGNYTDGSRDVTVLVDWDSSSHSAVTFTAPGKARGDGVGSFTVTAALDGKSVDVGLTVKDAELLSLSISPTGAGIAKGETATFTAIAQYTDGPRTVTNEATWGSSNTSVATVTAGQAKGVGVSVGGPIIITAGFDGKTATAELTVDEARLLSFTISSTSDLLYLGQTRQFKAVGHFTDDNYRDVTNLVAWESSAPLVAEIDADGLATALTPGQTLISANYEGLEPVTTELNVDIQAQVTATSVSWGSLTAPLATAADGVRLLPSGRSYGETIGWAGINRINITLDHDAVLTDADITVSSLARINYGTVTVTGSGKNWTITLGNKINAADRVTFSINNNPAIKSFERRLDVLPGDVNGDGVVSLQDVVYVRNGVQGFEPILEPIYFLDVLGDGDAKPKMGSLTAVLLRFGTQLPPLV